MAATPVTGTQLITDPIDPAALSRFEVLLLHMPRIAMAVDTFTDPTLRERAFHKLVGIINPSPDESEQADVIAAPQWGDAPTSAVDLDRLSEWINDKAPTAWRESVQHFEPITDAVTRFLDQGAQAWTQMLLVKHALMTAGGFSTEQVDGDLAALIREMAADAPVSPEVEELALRLKTQAQPGETASQVALRLMRELQADKVDDREQTGE